jgi:predicted HAD superfamily Cof-like phosphohydrolase
MNVFEQVVQFNISIIGIEARPHQLMDHKEVEFTSKALDEERVELLLAHNDGDIIGCIDALLDSIYFAVGALHKLGLTPAEMEACMTAVHESNMTKKKGVTDRGHENDAIKPDDWVPPEERIGAILDGGI